MPRDKLRELLDAIQAQLELVETAKRQAFYGPARRERDHRVEALVAIADARVMLATLAASIETGGLPT